MRNQSSEIQIDGDRLLADLRHLASFGKIETGVHRRGLTNPDFESREWLKQRMLDAGLHSFIDGVSNVVGITPQREYLILIGSHTDTVPQGGWLDGALGVIYGLEIARAFMENPNSDSLGVAVISFGDEEGRFTPLLGSRSVCGLLALEEITSLKAEDGELLGAALRDAGYAENSLFRLDSHRHIAYLEAHIEQGPVLEAESQQLGIVTNIVGYHRAHLTFEGQADHAGATPMHMRRDAAAAAIATIAALETALIELAGPYTVWNIGNIVVKPGAYNIVAERTEIYFEARCTKAATLDRIKKLCEELPRKIARERLVDVTLDTIAYAPPVEMHDGLVERLERACGQATSNHKRMPSGGGHDAMIFAQLIPTGMLFIPSLGGRSHSILENSRDEEIVLGAHALAETVSGIMRDGRV